MLKENFHIAVPTAFYEDESVNVAGTIQHIKHLYSQGVKSVLVCGSTGEQHSLTLMEKTHILQALCEEELIHHMEIIFGVSSIRQLEAEKLAKKIADTEIAGIMLGYPPYIVPTQDEALAYSQKVIDLADKPTILYNNPKRTGFDLSLENIIQLSTSNLVVGLKEAGNKQRIASLKNSIQKSNFYYYSGGELDLEAVVPLGFNRLSAIAANVYPQAIKHMFHKLLSKQPLTTTENEELASILKQVYTGSPLVNLKKHLNQQNIPMGICRSPLGNR